LARKSGLYVVTGGRPANAMLLLAAQRVRVRARKDIKLSATPELHARGLAVGVLEVGGVRYTVASMHLGLRGDERRRHVDELLYRLSEFTDPLILAGDVNEEPGEPAWQVLAGRLQDAGGGLTFSAQRPHKRIDAVFVDRRLEVVSCEVPKVDGLEQASDHLPLLAVVRPR
jgi:endonuclease/exonuclease/phosphatase family metal-dependent hydrolase